jgi:hypothetical protein
MATLRLRATRHSHVASAREASGPRNTLTTSMNTVYAMLSKFSTELWRARLHSQNTKRHQTCAAEHIASSPKPN